MRRGRGILGHGLRALAALALLCSPPGSVSAAPSARDLRDADGVVRGAFRVAAAGDFNGDGREDWLAVAGTDTEPSGAVFVVLGLDGTQTSSFDDLGERAVRINGPSRDSVVTVGASAGDVNGDRLGDIVVGANTAANNGRGASGTAYVVFGRESTETVELSLFDRNLQGDDGYRIDGASSLDFAGESVSGIRDLTGDGLDEVLVGAPFGGSSYVVPGKTTSEPVDLLHYDLGTNQEGFRVDHPRTEYNDLYEINRIGDFNGDGLEDFAIGVIRRQNGFGRVYVLYGRSSTQPLRVRELTRSDGFVVRGRRRGDEFGMAVSGAGTFDGDRFEDVLIGAPGAGDDDGSGGNGRGYVIRGAPRRPSMTAGDLGNRGFAVRGPDGARDDFGFDAVSAGDIDSDGYDDVVIAAPADTVLGREYAGSVWVVFGRAEPSSAISVGLGARRSRGFVGARMNDYAGSGVAFTEGSQEAAGLLLIGAEGCMDSGCVFVHRL